MRQKYLLLFLFSYALACGLLIQPARAQQSDEVALRDLTQRYFAGYTKKDLNAIGELWDQSASEFEVKRKALEKVFAASERIEVKDLSIVKVIIEGATARLRVTADVSVIESETHKLVPGQAIYTLYFIKTSSGWKVTREISTADDLAVLLIAAKTEKETSDLLSEQEQLLTAELPRAINRIGFPLADKGKYADAIAIFRLSLKIADRIGDKLAAAIALYNIGKTYYLQADYPKALEYHQKSLALREEIGDKTRIARALNNIGIIYDEQGQYEQALDYYKRTLKIYEQTEDQQGISEALNNIGLVNEERGDLPQALEFYRRSLAIKERLPDKLELSYVFTNLGNVNVQLGNYDSALDYFQKSLAIKESLNDERGQANALTNIGTVFHAQGNQAKALEYFEKSLSISERIKDSKGISTALTNIGLVYQLQTDMAQAASYLQRSLKLDESIGNQRGVAITLSNLGSVYLAEDNYQAALNHYQKSLAMCEKMGDKSCTGASLINLGVAYKMQGDYKKALEFYERSLSLSEAIGDRRSAALSLHDIAVVLNKQGKFAEAVEMSEHASKIARSIGDLYLLSSARTGAGRSYRELNQPSRAQQAFEEAIKVAETLRLQVAGNERQQQLFFEPKSAPYYEMVDLLVSQNKPVEAFSYAERAKGRALSDALTRGRVSITSAMSAEEKEEERRLTDELVSLNSQLMRESLRRDADKSRLAGLTERLQKARLELEAFQSKLYARHPELGAKRVQTLPISLDQARDLIPDQRTAIMEYVVTKKKTYLFVLTRSAPTDNNLKVYSIAISDDQLAATNERFRKQLAQRDLDFRQAAHNLYDLLIKPAREQLKGKSTVIIVPDKSLWNLPFQALQDDDGRYVIEDLATSYAPSLTSLRQMMSAGAARANQSEEAVLIAFGNAGVGNQEPGKASGQLSGGKLEPIPEAEEQVKALARLYGENHSRVYVGKDATEERLKAEAKKYQILYVATHGILDERYPMYSRLILSPSGKEDGLLEAWEIMNLNLAARLVVLSACETARGRIGEGEGITGMMWALFIAGAPATVVSQWKIDSESTRVLMLEFLRLIKPGAQGVAPVVWKSESLRQATLSLLKNPKYRHPFYWAAFILVGDAR